MNKTRNLIEYYDRVDESRVRASIPILRASRMGLYAPTMLEYALDWLEQLAPRAQTRFCDLGSGDGRVAHLFSLYGPSTGVEGDFGLHAEAGAAQRALGMTTVLVHGDFLDHDLSGYDVVYHYPDGVVGEALEEKLLTELSGELWVHGGELWLPSRLRVVDTLGTGAHRLWRFAR